MQFINATLFTAALFLLSACQKEVLTKPVSFKGTEYENLQPHDDGGRPNTMEKENISAELRSYVEGSLPEKEDLRKTNPGLLSSGTTTDLSITEKSDVYVTFVSQGTGNRNTLAYYTYTTGTPPASPKDIKKIFYFFPNAGHDTRLNAGDKVKLGSFQPGTSIGFVLLKDAWSPSTKTINKEAVHFCYNDVLNPEIDPALKKHVVLLNFKQEEKILIGFEDIDRTDKMCDHDFNDVVVYATIKR